MNDPERPERISWLDAQTPFSPRFQDIYRSRVHRSGSQEPKDLGLAQARHVFLEGCGLLGAQALWRGQAQWSILENGFGLGLNFLASYQAWRQDPDRPHHLHYFGIEAYPVDPKDLLRGSASFEELGALSHELHAHYWGMTPGLHRLTLAHGQVHLTLCIGPTLEMLPQIQGHFDSIYLDGFDPQKNPEMWGELTMKGIAAKAKWGACAATWSVSSRVRGHLEQAGFVCVKRPGLPPKKEALHALFWPAWRHQMLHGRASSVSHPELLKAANMKSPKRLSSTNGLIDDSHALKGTHAPHESPSSRTWPQEVVVIGAGLAGASMAHSLAQRGIRVLVLESQDNSSKVSLRSEPQGASSNILNRTLEQGAHGLPFGLFHPMSSRDDNLQSKMTRSGIRMLIDQLRHLPALKEGHDYAISGVLEKHKTKGRKAAPLIHSVDLASQQVHHEEPLNTESALAWSEHWSRPAVDKELHFITPEQGRDLAGTKPLRPPAQFHEKAGWVNVQALLSALLDHPLITVRTGVELVHLHYRHNPDEAQPVQSKDHPVHEPRMTSSPSLFPSPTPWTLYIKNLANPQVTTSYPASDVVLCTSVASVSILRDRLKILPEELSQNLPQDTQEALHQLVCSWPLQAIKGQLTLGEMRDLRGVREDVKTLPLFAINGESSWIGHLPSKETSALPSKGLDESHEAKESLDPSGEDTHDAQRFCIGASYEREQKEVVNSTSVRLRNVEKFAQLAPALQLHPNAKLEDWSGVRSTCQDRLPLVGALNPQLKGLWVMTALGSRGLSMSALLCSHLLSNITMEPSPLPKRLGQALDPARFLKPRPSAIKAH